MLFICCSICPHKHTHTHTHTLSKKFTALPQRLCCASDGLNVKNIAGAAPFHLGMREFVGKETVYLVTKDIWHGSSTHGTKQFSKYATPCKAGNFAHSWHRNSGSLLHICV